jgi:hypothetical protein
MTARMLQKLHANRIADELPYTGFLTLTVLSNGEWFSPSEAPHGPLPDGVEEYRYKWGWNTEGECSYVPVVR